MNERMIEAITGLGTALILFVPLFVVIFSARHRNARAAELRAARLKELNKYSIPLLDLR